MKNDKVPEDIQRLLKQVYDDCMQEDQSVRERQIRDWRRLKLLWEGFTRIWFSEVAHDWRVWDQNEDDNTDQAYYDKPVNVFKAYLESIIAALSVTVPPIKCFPDDADDTLDLATARAGDKIAQLVYRHNDAPLLWLHALFIYVTEGLVAYYNYEDYNKKYGTYQEKTYEDIEEEQENLVCSLCGFPLEDKEAFPGQAAELKDQEIDEFQPDNEDAPLHALINEGKEICPSCMMAMDPVIQKEKFITTRLTGVIDKPKGRICLEARGGLYIKIPNYCKKQKDLPYLIYSDEFDYSMVVEEYKHLHGNKNLLEKLKSGNNPGGYEWYAQWGRLSPQYQGEYPQNVVTVNKAWIRPGKFNILKDEEDVKKLKKRFPDGVKVTFVNEEFAEACNENLDDCWTLIENPMSDFLHFNPLGASLTSIQDITNDLISLTLQTIEHGIGQTFADPAVLNFNAYAQTSTLPGGVFPATPKSGKTLGEGFHELRTATLSPEVMPFGQQIQSYAQLASGATPSIFGGELAGAGGETASGYSMSRAQALQRLQNIWKLFTTTWKNVFSKVVPMYIKIVQEDERDVQRKDDGSFVNVLIRKSELQGKIGKVELDAGENLPLTWTQKKDLLFTLLQATNPKIMEILNAPENLTIIHEALGLVDFYVPGEDDIIKQYDEIKLLLDSEPIEEPPSPEMIAEAIAMGQPPPQMQEVPSVEIDPIYDNHVVEFDICRKWIVSEAGRQTKTDNPEGYRNVLLHGRLHFMEIQRLQMEQAMQAQSNDSNKKPGDNTPNEKRDKTKSEAPIMEEGNVSVIQ
jgi:hypothetical protein